MEVHTHKPALPRGDANRCPLDISFQLECRAAATPNAQALLAPGREPLTCAGLWSHIIATRQELRDAGLRPGEPAALVTRSGPELLTAFLAVAGESAYAPLDPSLSAAEYQSYLARIGARMVIVDDAAVHAIAAARELGLQVLRMRASPDDPAGVFTLNANEPPATPRPARRTAAALLLLTSATTGDPKLVPLTPANVHALARNSAQNPVLTERDRLLNMMPLFHMHGLSAALAQLFGGGPLMCVPGFEAANFVNWLEEFRPTWTSIGPPIARAIGILARQYPEPFSRSTLRFIRCSGAAAEPDLIESLEKTLHVPVIDSYSMSEAHGIARTPLGGSKTGSVGRSIGLEIGTMDDSGQLLPPDADGEIVVRGSTVTSGYLDDPDTNRVAFRFGWFHTGDIGRLDAEGYLYIAGRLKEMINRGGKKIFPAEVERELAAHAVVAEAAVFGIVHAKLGEEVAAAVVLREGATVNEQDLRSFLAARLAPFKIPRRIIFVDSIPRTSNGKIKRSALAEQYWNFFRSQADAQTLASPPPNAVEASLIALWGRILDASDIGVDDDFFALGGDSLAASIMLIEVQQTLHTSAELLDRADFFDHPTIRSLARIVAECGHTPDTENRPANRVLTLRATGSLTPFFCFPASDADPMYFRHLSKSLGADQPFFVLRHADPVRDKRLLSLEELATSSADEIRKLHPHGPYILGGHCYGGVVAFETALQLMSQGEQITCIVLLDANTPGYPKVHQHWKRYVIEVPRQALELLRRNGRVTIAAIGRHVATLARVLTRRVPVRASRALSAVGSDLLLAGQNQRTLNVMAMREYIPRDFPAPIVHFLAADQPVSTELLSDPRLEWNRFARAGLDVRRVPGDHNSLLAAHNASLIARQLEALLHRR